MMRKKGAPDPLPDAFGVPGTGVMLSWIRRIVGFGTRRPGYAQSLQVEKWLEERFREFGLEEVRFGDLVDQTATLSPANEATA